MKNIKWMKKPPVLRNQETNKFSNQQNYKIMKKPKLYIDTVDYMDLTAFVKPQHSGSWPNCVKDTGYPQENLFRYRFTAGISILK